jgi:hypothetical protein
MENDKKKSFWLVGLLSAHGLQLRWASGLLKRPDRLGGPTANDPDSWACRRAHMRTVTAPCTVASSPAVRCWPGGGSVSTVSINGVESGRRVRRRQRGPTVEAVWRGDGDGGSTRWCSTEEAAPVDCGGPDGARQLQWGVREQ